MGRYAGEEAEARAELSVRGWGLRLPGFRNALGPSVATWLGVPALRSSRASANGVRPFHLHHSTISKQGSARSVAKADRTYFSISRGQAAEARERAAGKLYWQPSAKCWWAPRGSREALRLAGRYALAPRPVRAPSPTSKPPGTAARHQRYIERAGAAAEDGEGIVYSLGTIGADVEERAAFWQAVEKRERADGLVQCRIIAEMPHELDARERRRVMDAFMETFEERGLPAHGVLHRPDAERRPEGGGDPRNVHAHIVYHDRPAGREERDRWSFAGKKDREARGPAWVRTLRQRWAEACNASLERARKATRFHPGSYENIGIEKLPQVHLGPVFSAFERQGRATRPGLLNLVSERAWERRQGLEEGMRLAEGSVEWMKRLADTLPPTGSAGREAHRTLRGRVEAFDTLAEAHDPDRSMRLRDRVGWRRRAELLGAFAGRKARRHGEHAARWRRVRAVAEEAARTVPGPVREDPAPATPSGRMDAWCRAAERRLEDARLLDRRAEIARELGRGRTDGSRIPTVEDLGEEPAALVRRIGIARGVRGRLERELAEVAGDDWTAQRRRRRREEEGRQDLERSLRPELGDAAADAVEALTGGGARERPEPPRPTDGSLAGGELHMPDLNLRMARYRRRERRRELDRYLAPVLGRRAGDVAGALVLDAERLGEAAAVAHDREGRVTVIAGGRDEATEAAATECLRRLLGRRRAAARAEKDAAAFASGDDRDRAGIARRIAGRSRREEAELRTELADRLRPHFGALAAEVAGGLVRSAELGSGGLVRRNRKAGGVGIASGDFDAAAAAGCFRLLLAARRGERDAEAAVEKGGGPGEEARRDRRRRRELRRELESVDRAIALRPAAMRLAEREGIASEIRKSTRRAARRRAAERDGGR